MREGIKVQTVTALVAAAGVTLIGATILVVFLGCAGVLFLKEVQRGWEEEERQQELERREPWRKYQR